MNISMLLNPGFSLFGIWDVKWYGVIMACSMIVGVIVALFTCQKKGYDKSLVLDLAIAVIPLALVGARLYFCIFYGVDSFVDIFKVWEGGMAIYGGVIGGFIGIVIISFIKKVPLLDLCDMIVPCLIIGQAIGRWGNFVNQEAYGSLIINPNMQWFPIGVYIDQFNFTSAAREQVIQAFGSLSGIQGAWFNATFFYESFWNIIGFIILMLVCYKVKIKGINTACYFMYYGLGRAIIEGFRTDSLYLWGTGIRVSQALSMLLIVLGVVMLLIILQKYKDKLEKNPQPVVQEDLVETKEEHVIQNTNIEQQKTTQPKSTKNKSTTKKQ